MSKDNIQPTVTRPYRLMAVPLKSGESGTYHYHAYVKDRRFAEDPRHYVTSLGLISKDLDTIFEFVEPAPENLKVYSHRISQLLIRTCIEIEAHFRNIFNSNTPPKATRGEFHNINDFRLIDVTHKLSSYAIRITRWQGGSHYWEPFADWKNNESPSWWIAYNKAKHNRGQSFAIASLDNLIAAIGALCVIYYSQYMDETFSSRGSALGIGGAYGVDDGMESSVIPSILIRPPRPEDYEFLYEFSWKELSLDEDAVKKFDYRQLQQRLNSTIG